MERTVETIIRMALDEDVAHGDGTTLSTVPLGSRCHTSLIAKSDGILSGITVFRCAFELVGSDVEKWEALDDGASFKAGDRIAYFEGRTRGVLTAERVAMNFLQHLSGVATTTHNFVEAVGDLPARIADTRKTTPMLRVLEKAAVRHGGGVNHRFNLADGILIKENHIIAAGGITEAIHGARGRAHHLQRVEIEVETLEELDLALSAGADAILLDNMDNDTLRKAVAKVAGKDILLEASGNMTLDRVRGVAETGVNLISVGALTHSSPAVDISLLIENV